MKKLLAVLAIGALAVASSVHAAEDRTAKIARLIVVQDTIKIFQEMREYAEQKNMKQAHDLADQAMAQLNPPEAIKKPFELAVTNYVQKLKAPWSTQEVVDYWTQTYAAKFSDEELDQLIVYYSSPLAKKEESISRTAMLDLSQHFQDMGKPILEKATKEYIQDIQTIIKECKCIRPKVISSKSQQ